MRFGQRIQSSKSVDDSHKASNKMLGKKKLSRKVWPSTAASIFIVACIIALFSPTSYVIEAAGPTVNVLGDIDNKDVIAISGAQTHQDSGKLLMTTVNASDLPVHPLGFEVLYAWASPYETVIPREAVYQNSTSQQDFKQQVSQQMQDAQNNAKNQGLVLAQKHGISTENIQLSMDAGDIGGPSAGMMYTLGIVDKLTPYSLTGGQTIAGTGTIDNSGKIGAIGGIQLKLLGAQRDGATWFLAPSDNCSEVVGHVPQGLRDVAVSTIDQAYDAVTKIGQGQGQDLPHCAVSNSDKS